MGTLSQTCVMETKENGVPEQHGNQVSWTWMDELSE